MPNASSSSVKVFYPRFSRSELIALLRERMPALAAALPLRRVVLFGSWASGRATAFSDIDLLVIYADPPREDAYGLIRKAVHLRGLEPHIYSERQAQQLSATLTRMSEGGVVLYGGE